MTNPNTFDVTGTVADDILVEPTDTCVITGGATQTFPAGKTTPVAYTCTFSSKPSYALLTNCVSVTWQKPGITGVTVNKGEATFQFGTGSAGNPSTTHDGIDVYDIFNGAPAPGTLLGHTTVSTSYPVHKDIVVPSGVSGCVNVDNTATFTDANTNNTPSNSSSVTTHVCVAGHDLTIKKTVNPSYTTTYTWTIDKKVNGKDSDGPISSDQPTVPAHYTVVTTKTGVEPRLHARRHDHGHEPEQLRRLGCDRHRPGPDRLHLHGRRRHPRQHRRGRLGRPSTTPARTPASRPHHRHEPRHGELAVRAVSRTTRPATPRPVRMRRTTSRTQPSPSCTTRSTSPTPTRTPTSPRT